MAKPVTTFLDQIRDGDQEQRDRATRSIQRLTQEDVECVPQLLSYLSQGDPLQRQRAARGLAMIVPQVKNATAALIQAIADPDDKVRFRAITVLVSIGSEAIEATPDLIRCLGDSSITVRSMAAHALLRLNPLGEGVGSAVIDLFNSDTTPTIRFAIMQELHLISTPEAIFILSKGLQDDSRSMRWYATIGLKMLGARAIKAKGALEALLLVEGDSAIRVQAQAALERMHSS